MVCEAWKAKLDTYLDGELPASEMRSFDAHVPNCPVCAADILPKVRMKRAVHLAGKRFAPEAEFRKRIQLSLAKKQRRTFHLRWTLAPIVMVLLVAGVLTSGYLRTRADALVFSEIADSHVTTLASSSPVDVVSTDRHTVKPWFQGKIPFAFNLPEFQNSEFSLVGGRLAYLQQTPGAHLICDVRKHHISVFIFQEQTLPAGLSEASASAKKLPFSMETWSQGGLRYFVIGDASAADIKRLASLFKTAS